MIRMQSGDITEVKRGLICQQVNCRGTMAAGLAKQLREKYPYIYDEYKEFIYARKVHHIGGNQLLGAVNPVFINKDLLVINIFGQEDFGTDGVYTDYEALEKALRYIEETVAPSYNLPVYIPRGIGCGLGGGDWKKVSMIINDVFADSDVNCIVMEYKK